MTPEVGTGQFHLCTTAHFPTALPHRCCAANLRIVIFNGELVFDRLLGNGWSDLDDFFRQKFWFRWNAEEIISLARLRARACNIRITRLADFGQFWPKCASVSVMANFSSCVGVQINFRGQSTMQGEHFRPKNHEIQSITPKFGQKYGPVAKKISAIFVKRPIKPLGKIFRTQKTDCNFFLFFSELQELEVRNRVQPKCRIFVWILKLKFV